MWTVAIILAVAIITFYVIRHVLPAAERHDRRKAIERNMRQEIVDQETQRQVAKKLLKEAGQK